LPSYTEMVAVIQDQFLDALKQAQDRSVGVVESAGRVAAGIVPARLLTRRIDGAVPPEEVVKLTFGFGERLMAQQKSYAERIVAALDSAGSEASKARTTPRPRKAAARTGTRATAHSAASRN
jgi:hypothetical protein